MIEQFLVLVYLLVCVLILSTLIFRPH